MDPELEKLANLIRESRDPEDLFGVEPVVLPRGAQLKKREEAYRAFKAVTAAEYHSLDDREVARDLDRQLDGLFRRAQARIEAGTYNLQGRGRPVSPTYRSRFFNAGSKRYYIGGRFREGEETTLYNGYLEADGAVLGEVVLKVAKSPETSVFVEREANVLAILRQEEYRETNYLPWPLDRFESGGRLGLVRRRVDGFNLREIRQYPLHERGLDTRDMSWMMSRVLAVAGLAHRHGVVHGRICPEHVVIEPATHLAMVTGWGGSALAPAQGGQRVLNPILPFSAPEAAETTAGPWSDVYSIGKTFLWLVGGDPETEELPADVEPRLAAYLRNMVHEDPRQRPEDCWQLFESFGRLKGELWGEPRWRHLEMPPPSVIG